MAGLTILPRGANEGNGRAEAQASLSRRSRTVRFERRRWRRRNGLPLKNRLAVP